MAARTIYSGSRRKLVLAFDLGTTYSGISYRFPAQETITGASKIPTIIYYDQQGKIQAVGAETQTDGIYERAEEGNWVKAEWFKLHLRSKYGKGSQDITSRIPPLPPRKTILNVIADFLQYLLQCAKSYIAETHANGAQLWASVETSIDYVLSHPNGWEGMEQTQMRKAAVMAGLVPDSVSGHKRISFVTEGEASLHFAIQSGVLASALQNGEGVVIVDAGGGTVDISSYRKAGSSDKSASFEEISSGKCYFHGSVFVTIHAQIFLQSLLANSAFIDDLDHIVHCFDKTTKPRFRNDQEPQYIKFGTIRDNDAKCGIRFGQLKLDGMATFFKPSIDCIVDAVKETKKSSLHKISHVVLVGGFSASDWLYENVNQRLTSQNLNVVRPDNHVNKAVSDGAISFYLDHFVRTRVSKMTYGTFCHIAYDPKNPQHRKRQRHITYSISGEPLLPDAFFVILPKDTQVQETTEFRDTFFLEEKSMRDFRSSTSSVYCYRGKNPDPKWKDEDTSNYTLLCSIYSDLSHLPIKPQKGSSGTTYYRADWEVVLQFGLTELTAQMVWEEKGVEKRSSAKVVYDPDASRDDF